MESKLETDKLKHSLANAHVKDVAPWCAMFLIMMFLCLAVHAVPTALFCVFLAGFFVIREYAKYASERYAISLPKSEEKKTAPKDTIRKLCDYAGVKPPSLGTAEGSLGAMYDPNTATITLGDMLETGDGTLASILHECSHHILLTTDPADAHRRRTLLSAASAAQTVSFVMAVTFVALVLLGSSGSAMAFDFFLISTLFSKAAITTHEYDTNRYAISLIEADDGELGVVDKNRTAKYLRLCERTYTIDFWGWVGLALFASTIGIGI